MKNYSAIALVVVTALTFSMLSTAPSTAQQLTLEGGALLSACKVSQPGNVSFCSVANDPQNPAGLYVSANAGAYSLLNSGFGAGVISWNKRTGDVVPQSGDYTFAIIGGQVGLSQLPPIPFAGLSGQIQLSQIPPLPFTQMSGTIALSQMPQVPFTQISGQIAASQFPSAFTISGPLTCQGAPGTIKSGFTANCSFKVSAVLVPVQAKVKTQVKSQQPKK